MSEFIPFQSPDYDANFVLAADVAKGLQDARQSWMEARNIAMATTCPNDDPHSTVLASGLPKPEPDDPQYAAGLLQDGRLPFWSFLSRHVTNLRWRNVASFSIFSSEKNQGALTIKAQVEEVRFDDIDEGLVLLNAVRTARGIGPPKPKEDFDPARRRHPAFLFIAHPAQLSVGVRGFEYPDIESHSSNVELPVTLEDLWPSGPPANY